MASITSSKCQSSVHQRSRPAASARQAVARPVALRSFSNTQSEAATSSRRDVIQALTLSVVGLASSSIAGPAQAFLGIGEDGSAIQANYDTRTTGILSLVRTTLELPKDDPVKEDKVKELRKEINTWVADFRREPKVSGRPSYGQTYSVLNALAGHYNSFGATAPIPKKRLERINKELADATLYLSRGR